MWDLQSDGELLLRGQLNTEISPFNAEKEIRSLAAYPLSFMPEGEKKHAGATQN
jgi:hypothetical protein